MVRRQLNSGNITEALNTLRTSASAFTDEDFLDRIEACATEYHYMSDFMLQGYRDERREVLFHDLCQRIIGIEYDIDVRTTLRENPYVKTWMKRINATDTSAEAMQSLLLSTEHDIPAHYDALSLAFMSLLVSYHWRTQRAEEWALFLSSTSANPIDAATLTSAISLSLMQNYSRQKAHCLAMIYKMSKEETVRQRALVGCLLGLTFATRLSAYNNTATDSGQKEILSILFQDEKLPDAVMELQMQMIRCANAKSDETQINRDIMPTLLKNQPFRITPRGIVERDEEAEERENPDSTYKEIDAMEDGIKKMLDMQKQGTDIFFGGFKQMKRYPFFYKMVNWFMPYYSEHPDLASERQKIGNSEFVSKITQRGPFCDSDKYSFIIAMASVMSSLPESVQKMMEQGEVGPIGMAKSDEEAHAPSLLRLQYLQNLYRFYELNPISPSLKNPFRAIPQYALWTVVAPCLQSKVLRQMFSYIMRHNPTDKNKRMAEQLLDAFADADGTDYLLCKAEICVSQEKYADAIAAYETCLKRNVGDAVAMRGIASACYAMGQYEQSSFYFDALHTLYPKRNSYLLNYAMSMVRLGKSADVLNELYRLDYENPDNLTIRNTLGWALLHAGKAEQALAVYDKIDESAISADFSLTMNRFYALLANADIRAAVHLLRQWRGKSAMGDAETFRSILLSNFSEDAPLLANYGFGQIEQLLLADAVCKED